MSRDQGDDKFKPIEVTARNGESVDRMIKRFSKKVRADGILQEFNDSRYYTKKSTKRRKKRLLASWNSQSDTRN